MTRKTFKEKNVFEVTRITVGHFLWVKQQFPHMINYHTCRYQINFHTCRYQYYESQGETFLHQGVCSLQERVQGFIDLKKLILGRILFLIFRLSQGIKIFFHLQRWYLMCLVVIVMDKESVLFSPQGHACLLSCFSCVQFFAALWIVACQAPLSMDSPGKNTGVSCQALLQRIFLTEGWNLHLFVSCIGRCVLYLQCHLGSPSIGTTGVNSPNLHSSQRNPLDPRSFK